MVSFNEDMPTELITQILNNLNLVSMLQCRAVCSRFRDLIDLSPQFHWKVELAIAGKEDGANYPLATRRKMLEQHQQGWTDLRWTTERRIPIQFDGLWELYGDVFAHSSTDRSEIRFKKIPSQSRNIQERDWMVEVKEYLVDDIAIDPAQDLLVILEELPENGRIFLWTLSTGDPHPFAAGTLMQKRVLHRKSCSIQICGDVLGVLFQDHAGSNAEAVFWNWKTGRILADIVRDSITAMTLLSEEYIMFGVLETPTVPSLVVVDFTSEPPEPQHLCNVKRAFTFYFPPLAQKASIIDVDVRSDPSPSWTPNSELPVPFFTSRHHRIYVITILLAPDGIAIESQSLQFFALGNFFISLTRKFADQVPAYIDWPAWGPEGTRMLVVPTRLEWFVRYVYGSRYVTTNGRLGLGDQLVYIYDFNQAMLRWKTSNITNDAASADTSTTTESAEDSTKANNLKSTQPWVNVTTPSRFADRTIFQVDVETKLGYRMSFWKIPQEWRRRSVMCSEDGIVIVNIDEDYQILTV